MQITIHRGLNQIGGNVVEIATGKTKILLDAGLELESMEETECERTELDFNKLLSERNFAAVFISHYHADHVGLLKEAKKLPPVYMGEMAFKLFKATEEYKKQTVNFTPSGYLQNQLPIHVGDITITPLLSDHSAFDSYSFVIEADGKTIVYSGDFRGSGRKSYNRYLQSLPQNVDAVICEGTNAGKDDVNVREDKLETEMFNAMTEAKQVFVLMSALNIDRIVTVFKAAKKARRIMLQDVYMSFVTDICGKSIPNPRTFNDVYAFTSKRIDDERHQKYFSAKDIKKMRIEKIPGKNFVMCVRSSFKSCLQKLNDIKPLAGSVLIYSMWNGYKQQQSTQEFLDFAESLGIKVIDIHTSGHADRYDLHKFLARLNPQHIIPIHTVNTEWFIENYEEEKVVVEKIFTV